MTKPSFSIVVPVYGVEKYIGRCAETLFSQTYDNIQFVFVNDGTKDKSMEVLAEVLEGYQHLKNRVVIVNKENGGLPAARKTGDRLLSTIPNAQYGWEKACKRENN